MTRLVALQTEHTREVLSWGAVPAARQPGFTSIDQQAASEPASDSYVLIAADFLALELLDHGAPLLECFAGVI
ncbi:hypothetical protein ENSA7_46650 [Enhygromyxa salina]|uniref:Uncharacterized protein n=1 Tax=Enhygromyxa salina TaxID=215803 RepID=A0A2S9YJD5_9BACT|nr:hypothetical protein ENSA7_46650 [Enhygromyxa salina]